MAAINLFRYNSDFKGQKVNGGTETVVLDLKDEAVKVKWVKLSLLSSVLQCWLWCGIYIV